MFTAKVLTVKEKKRIYDRIRQAMGNFSQIEVAKMMTKAGFPITSKAFSAWSAGRAAPTSESLVGLAKVLGLSIDYILTGKNFDNPDYETIRKIVDSAAVEKGFALRDLDPETAKIMEILIDLKAEDRAPLAAMVEAYVNQRARK